jgi:hypothetical protein
MKLKGEVTYYFAIPLQSIHLKNFDVHFSKKYGFCSFYYPSVFQDDEDFLYLIKVYDLFNDQILEKETVKNSQLLFGESLHFPLIPNRGKMKWLLLGEEKFERGYDSFPDLRVSSLPTTLPPEKRNWFVLKNANMNQDSWNKHKRTYLEVKDLELGEKMWEGSVKLRIYICVLKNEFKKRNIVLTTEEWINLLLNIMINEESAKKTDQNKMKDFINSFAIDYLNNSN